MYDARNMRIHTTIAPSEPPTEWHVAYWDIFLLNYGGDDVTLIRAVWDYSENNYVDPSDSDLIITRLYLEEQNIPSTVIAQLLRRALVQP